METYTNAQLDWVHKQTGKTFCSAESGVITNIHTGQIVPENHIQKGKAHADGKYELCKYTCGDGMPMGFNRKLLKSEPAIENPTEADKDKYQCRIGRHAPLCTMYEPGTCAVYGFDAIGRYQVHIDFKDLVALSGIG